MKVKVQLDLASIKNWLLAHGEKVALSIVGIVFLLFTYSAIQRESLDANKQPDDLTTLASRVDGHVRNSSWDPTRENLQVVNYAERAKSRPLELTDYPLKWPFNPPDSDPKAKRSVPEVLGVEELRVASGYDLMSIVGKAAAGQASESVQAQPWAVVTGLVPVARQKEEYEKAFGQAVGSDAERDTPRYPPPALQRSLVDPSDPTKVEWTWVRSARGFEGKWGKGSAPEIVSGKYVDSELTGRLGNLANKQQKWGESVGHPKVPLIGEEKKSKTEAAEPQPEEPKDDAAEDRPQNIFGSLTPKVAPPKPVEKAQTTEPEVVEYRLLRAFDYSVEPGKKYRYRVTLGLTNPNHRLPPQQLKDPESARAEYLTSKPSEPTAVVTIPDGHRVLAGSVDPGTRYSEPTATLLVSAIDQNAGLEAATEMTDVHRGTLANVQPKQVKARVPGSTEIKEITRDFRSNTLVLDIYGGRDLSRRRGADIKSPGEILLLDAEGNMVVRNDMDDQPQYESTIVRDAPVAAPEKKPLLNDKKKPARIR